MDTLLQNPHALMAAGIFILVYLMLILERLPKVVISLLGATAVIMLGILDQKKAFHYIDFNVIFLLVGMMIIVSILQQTGAFEYLGRYCARKVNGSGVKLMIAFALLTAFFSAFLDNVTTVLFMGSITGALALRMGFNPVPFLISEVIASNVGGTATLIGDPPNILIGSAGGLSFNDFIINVAPPILLMLPVVIGTLYLFYHKQLEIPVHEDGTDELLSLEGVITDKPLLIKALIVLACVLTGFVFHHVFHQEVGTVALAGAAILMAFEDPKELWNDVEWDTIFFFIGLFIVVGAIEEVGILKMLADLLVSSTAGNFNVITMAILWASGFLSAIIDNIPYTVTMLPLIKDVGTHHFDNIQPLWWALSLGACLGGNGTIIGASANVVMSDMAANRFGKPIRFVEFMAVGSVIVVECLIIASVYLWLRYLM